MKEEISIHSAEEERWPVKKEIIVASVLLLIAWIAAWIQEESERVAETIKARLVEWARNRQQENCMVLIIR